MAEKMLTVGNIVTIENGIEYLLADKIYYKGKQYFYAVETDENENWKSYVVLEGRVVDGEEYITFVEDMDIQQEVLKIQKNKALQMRNQGIKILVIIGILMALAVVLCFVLSFPLKILPVIVIVICVIYLIRIFAVSSQVRKIAAKQRNDNVEEKTW